MAGLKYTQMQAKNRHEVTKSVDGKNVTTIKFKGVLRYRVPNDGYKEKPEGDDTRTANEKRRYVWKEVSKMLEAPKGRSKKQTDANVTMALESWRGEMEAKEHEPKAHSMSVYELVDAYITRREKLSEAVGWDTSKKLGNEKIIDRSTVRDYRHVLRMLEGEFKTLHIDELDTLIMLDWEERKTMEGASLTRVRKAHVLIKAALNDAVIRGIVRANPISTLKAPTAMKHENNSLTQADAQRFTFQLAMLEPSKAVVGAMLALHTGMRGGEICGLQWGCVDFDTRHITVANSIGVGDNGKYLKEPKTENGKRVIWMDDYVSDMLRKLKAQTLRDRMNIETDFGDLYVVGSHGGEDYLSPTTLSRQFTALAKAFGLRGKTGETVTLHKLRHSFADALRGGKGETKAIRDVMGHSSKGITDMYGTRDQELMDEAVRLASEWLAPSSGMKPTGDLLTFGKTGTDNE